MSRPWTQDSGFKDQSQGQHPWNLFSTSTTLLKKNYCTKSYMH